MLNKNTGKKNNAKGTIKKAREKFADFFDMPKELVCGLSKFTMVENNMLLIESYKQIVDYTDSFIKIRTNNIDVNISGKELDIKEVTNDDLLIEGIIHTIIYNKMGE